jgi:A/G-specific adenine glycosylase
LRQTRLALLRWYQRTRRDLPWRRTRDPYKIWISEIMLQQTRVAAVIPYYEKFLAAFPDSAALAEASEERVLAMWAGLGYYSRARNLHKAVKDVQQLGRFPDSMEEIRKLPGVGDYTAAAIASIAFGLPHAAVDGNAKRVIARLTASENNLSQTADRLLDRRDPGRWNQALMELGATICLPRDPRCEACPVARFCAAKIAGREREFPAKRAKAAPVRLKRILLLIQKRNRILLRPGTRVRGFWDLPEPFDSARIGPALATFRHTITFRHYEFELRRASAGSIPADFRWFAEHELHQIPLSTVAKKALSLLTHTP